MFKRINKSKAQTTLEYAVLIAVIVGGLIAMQIYLRRGYQGKLREQADNMGEQFSPGQTTYNYNTTSRSDTTEHLAAGTTTATITEQTSTKTGTEHVNEQSAEYNVWSADQGR